MIIVAAVIKGQGSLTSSLSPPQGRRGSPTSYTTGIASPGHFIIKQILFLLHVSLFWWEFLPVSRPEKCSGGTEACVTLSCRVRPRESVWPWPGTARSQAETSDPWCGVRVGRSLSNLKVLSLLSSPSGCLSLPWRLWFYRSSKVGFLGSFHTLPSPTHQSGFAGARFLMQLWSGRKLWTWSPELWLWISILPLINLCPWPNHWSSLSRCFHICKRGLRLTCHVVVVLNDIRHVAYHRAQSESFSFFSVPLCFWSFIEIN